MNDENYYRIDIKQRFPRIRMRKQMRNYRIFPEAASIATDSLLVLGSLPTLHLRFNLFDTTRTQLPWVPGEVT